MRTSVKKTRHMSLDTVRDSVVLHEFVQDSNRIEGVHRPVHKIEISAHLRLLRCEVVTVAELEQFVEAVQPKAVLRRQEGCNVEVGDHFPPEGGPQIERALEVLLSTPGAPENAYERHHQYETLHPFTDGNGRSGRALWLRDMGGMQGIRFGFLHTWYYQSLKSGFQGEYQWPST